MPSVTLTAPSGRYLGLAEREEITLLRAERRGVREIARQLSRCPSTVSRGLRRSPGADLGSTARGLPRDESTRVSHEAIYQSLYLQGRERCGAS